MSLTPLDINVADVIPHRPPILLVDHVMAYTPESDIHTTRRLAEDDPVFEGHFPGQPILPGVLGVEALAQSAALLVNLTLGKTHKEAMFYFMSIEDVKFRRMITPGMTLDLHVAQLKQKRHIYKFAGKVLVNGDVMTEATFMAKLELKDA